jgi:hypothetical protein
LLSACGKKEKKSPSESNVSNPTLKAPVATLLPGCDVRGLENWYEITSTLLNTFKQESLAAVDSAAQGGAPDVERLISLRDAVAEQAVPECVTQTQDEVMARMNKIVAAFQGYASGAITLDDLRQQVQQAVDEINTVVADMLKGVETNLSQQFQPQ